MHLLKRIQNTIMQILRWMSILIVALCAISCILFLILYLSLPDVSELVDTNPSTTAFIELRREEANQKGSLFKLQWNWVPLNQISPFLKQALLYSEDPTFWSHKGIDLNRIKRAFQLNWYTKQIKNGGSTITQQVAKNLYLSPSQTIYRKIRECLIAFELERHLNKERILEIYLNISEWGNGVFGVEAAAHHWYQRSAFDLDPQQAVNMVLALPNPFKRDPTNLTPTLKLYTNQLIIMLYKDGVIDYEDFMNSLYLPSAS